MRITPFFAAAAMLLLAACFPPTTTHPVGSTTATANDPALTGLWRGKSDQSTDDRGLYFHFLPTSDNTITVVMVQAGPEPDGDWMIASITTATLGGNHIMNAQIKFSDGKAEEDSREGTIPLLYRFEGPNRLVLYLMDEDATKAAIQAHKITGTVEQGQFGDAVITAPSKDLDAFLATKKGAALFGERFATLTKME